MADILGTEFNELLFGTDGDDIINGFSGYDTLDGGEGSDTYIVNAGDFQNRYVDFYQDSGASGTDIILAGEAGVIIGIGNGFSYASSGIEAIDGVEGSTISGDNDRQVWDFTGVEITGVDLIFGMGGHDEIRGSNLADIIDGGTGHDVLFGGLGADNIMGGEGHDVMHGEDGNDTLEGGLGHDQLFGGNGRDTLSGGDWNDILYGGEGRDFLNGNAGFDILDGGNGSDVYYVGLDNAGFVDEYNDTGESGRDVIRALEVGTVIGLISGFGPDSGIEVITSARHEDVTIGGTNDAEVWDFSATQLGGIQWINALDGNDDVTGSARRDQINGGDGNDIIDGGAGNDNLVGGNGFDFLLGGEGKDRLEGGAGSDIMDGGEGSDVYLFNLASNDGFNTIVDSGIDGKDVIRAMEDGVQIGLGQSFNAANGIEVITSARHENVTIEGDNAGNNWDFSAVRLNRIEAINSGDGMDVVVGNSQRNVINGDAGFDQLYGGAGRDTLSGGDDSDFLFGESGADSLFGDAGNDVLTGGLGRDTLTGGEGFDIFVFGPESGRDVVTDFDVNADLIDLRAYEGELTYEDLRFVQGSKGLAIFMGDNRVLLENVFLEVLSAELFIFPELETAEVEVTPEEVAVEEIPVDPDMKLEGGNNTDTLEGGSGNDEISSSHGDDTAYGNGGDDFIDGGNGNDALYGGAGNDELIGSHGDDNLFGGDGDDILDGGNNEDRLEGGAGNDTLIGFNGRDILIGGDGDDRLDGGNDDDVLDGGAGDDYLYGFNGRDTLNGGAGNDTLIGYNDDDVMTGGEGNDLLIGGWGNDTFIFGENSGNDTISDYEDGRDILEFRDLVDDFSDLTITQDGADTVISSANGTLTLTDTDSSLIDASDFFFG